MTYRELAIAIVGLSSEQLDQDVVVANEDGIIRVQGFSPVSQFDLTNPEDLENNQMVIDASWQVVPV